GATGETLDTTQHPYFQDVASYGGIDKFYFLFKRNVSKYSKDRAAICIAQLF
ncbi:MAG: hypothetical protein EZS28_018511, partial [Streblomastix strix]